MKIKTSELTDAGLDWAVAKCEGTQYRYMRHHGGDYNGWTTGPHFLSYSTDWEQGGPIIEREQIAVIPDDAEWSANLRYAPDEESAVKDADATGATPLIAAMRCYVASKLGDEVDVPEELLA